MDATESLNLRSAVVRMPGCPGGAGSAHGSTTPGVRRSRFPTLPKLQGGCARSNDEHPSRWQRSYFVQVEQLQKENTTQEACSWAERTYNVSIADQPRSQNGPSSPRAC